MNIRKLLLVLFLFLIIVFTPRLVQAVELPEVITSENSIITKIQEGVEYFFAFGTEKKVAVLEKHAEKRLTAAQTQAELGNNERVQGLVQNYLQVKERQNNLLEKTGRGEVLGAVQERTIEQQKTMEQIKTRIDEGARQEVIQVQEQVVNQVAQRVVEINGPEGQTEFFNEVKHVWAPGTGPGGEAGVVVEGGEAQFAPGTGPGGEPGRKVEVVIEGGEMRFAPGTEPGSGPGGEVKTDIQNVVVESDNASGNQNGTPNNSSEKQETTVVEE
ncbi:MAG: DUF5667 domain-containing protein [Candidatus Shapirobacteria bacterium]|nr:DUF5667 domain-containing protein [Candidatus Shapirobacteria bacterium]